MTIPGRRILARFALVVLGWGGNGPAIAADLHTDPDEQMLFDLRIGDIHAGNGVRAFNTPAGLCLDVVDLIDGLQLNVALAPDGRSLSGWAFDPSYKIAIDRAKGQARFGGRVEAIAERVIWQSRSGWCVIASDLGRWLDITFEPDTTNAILHVKANALLPIEAALRRAADAERLSAAAKALEKPLLPRVALPYRPWRDPSLDLALNTGWERSADNSGRLRGSFEMLGAGELAYMSATMRLASDESGRPESIRLKLYRDDADGRLLGPLRATGFAVGDVASGASAISTNSVQGRGMMVTNSPVTAGRPDFVDFRGETPRGWDTELYRNGALIASDPANDSGRYTFTDVALQSGQNEFEIVQFGPQGQIRRTRRSYQLGATIPVRGETWWRVSAVDGQRELIGMRRRATTPLDGMGMRFDADVDHGLGKGVSFGASFHDFASPGGRRGQVIEGRSNATLLGMFAAVNLGFATSGGAAVRSRLLGRLGGINFALEDVRNRGLSSERLDAAQRAATQLSLDLPARLGGVVLPVHFDLRSAASQGERTINAQMRISATLQRLALSGAVRMQRAKSVDGAIRSESEASLLFNGRLGSVRMRGETQWGLSSGIMFRGASLTATAPLGSRDIVNATVGYAATDGTAFVALNLSRDLGFAALSLNMQGDDRRRHAIGLGLRFSLGPDAFGRFGRAGAVGRTATGALAVRVFRDVDGDGLRDESEPFIPSPGLVVNDVPIAATPGVAHTHAPKPDAVDNLEPAVPVRIALNESAIGDPFDVPSTTGVAAVPRAGLTTTVELGITGTVTIEGTLLGGADGLAGEPLRLVDANGATAYRFTTEFDGFFSLERVRYGQYELRMERQPDNVPGLRIVADPDRLNIKLGRISLGAARQLAVR